MLHRSVINALSLSDLAFSLPRIYQSKGVIFRVRLGRFVVSRPLGAGVNFDGNAYRGRMSDQSNPLGSPGPYKLLTRDSLVGMPIEALTRAKRCKRNSRQRMSSHLSPL